jgi:hypothetical protein
VPDFRRGIAKMHDLSVLDDRAAGFEKLLPISIHVWDVRECWKKSLAAKGVIYGS